MNWDEKNINLSMEIGASVNNTSVKTVLKAKYDSACLGFLRLRKIKPYFDIL